MAKRLPHLDILATALAAVVPLSMPAAAAPTGQASSQSAQRDGSHDFDWDIGSWKTHQRRLLHPLTGSNTWVDYHGTDVVRKLWNGGNSGMIEADGAAGHLEIFTIRLYSPDSHQWSIAFTNPSAGTMSPAVTGEFKNGRAEFYDQESYKGREILVRFVISDMSANHCKFEQAFSDDGGKTWETNFIVTESRLLSPVHPESIGR